MHHLTPRYKANRLISYQMTCSLAAHNKSGRCTKELAISKAGSQQNARRVLKAWVLLGHSLHQKEAHVDDSLKRMLLISLTEGTLASEDTLDSIAVATGDEIVQAPFVAPSASASSSRDGVPQESLLGDVATNVPPEIHREMLALAAQGAIPITTLSQRHRNKRSGRTEYGVPKGLANAFEYGYVHPNLPPPLGLVWQHQSGKWKLLHRGG